MLRARKANENKVKTLYYVWVKRYIFISNIRETYNQ
jgi:hypothetical protein